MYWYRPDTTHSYWLLLGNSSLEKNRGGVTKKEAMGVWKKKEISSHTCEFYVEKKLLY
jgi:hypothetical protein